MRRSLNIELKRIIKLAVPDALIAATAIEGGFTSVTADKGFKRIKDLNFMVALLFEL